MAAHKLESFDDRLLSWLEVTTSKDVPGFVSNALLMPFINEVKQGIFLSSYPISIKLIFDAGYHVLRKGTSQPIIWRKKKPDLFAIYKGIATRDDIDKTLKLGMNHPMGPLTLGELS